MRASGHTLSKQSHPYHRNISHTGTNKIDAYSHTHTHTHTDTHDRLTLYIQAQRRERPRKRIRIINTFPNDLSIHDLCLKVVHHQVPRESHCLQKRRKEYPDLQSFSGAGRRTTHTKFKKNVWVLPSAQQHCLSFLKQPL